VNVVDLFYTNPLHSSYVLKQEDSYVEIKSIS